MTELNSTANRDVRWRDSRKMDMEHMQKSVDRRKHTKSLGRKRYNFDEQEVKRQFQGKMGKFAADS